MGDNEEIIISDEDYDDEQWFILIFILYIYYIL
jgi:hypothetical protein